MSQVNEKLNGSGCGLAKNQIWANQKLESAAQSQIDICITILL